MILIRIMYRALHVWTKKINLLPCAGAQNCTSCLITGLLLPFYREVHILFDNRAAAALLRTVYIFVLKLVVIGAKANIISRERKGREAMGGKKQWKISKWFIETSKLYNSRETKGILLIIMLKLCSLDNCCWLISEKLFANFREI